MRASAPDFAKKFNILDDAGFTPGDDQIERLGPCKRENMLIVGDALDAPASLAKTFVSNSSTSPPDATKSAVFCVVGATALLQGVVISDPAYATGMIVAANFRPSGRCGVTPRSETGQSFGLILKAWDSAY